MNIYLRIANRKSKVSSHSDLFNSLRWTEPRVVHSRMCVLFVLCRFLLYGIF